VEYGFGHVVAIKMQLMEQNKVSFALRGSTSMDQLAISSVIAYYTDQNWKSCEVQLAFHKVDRPILSTLERYVRMTG
jgi:hypothetical protein